MRHLTRLMALSMLAALLAAAPVAASSVPVSGSAGASSAAATSTTDSALSTAKVAIIVGATGSETSHYRDIADSAYATAIQYSSNVVKVYSPNATWSAVSAAVTGASLVIYLGHGNGWPSPYTYDPSYKTKDGFGLNSSAGHGDDDLAYYGEPSMATLKLAPNAVVILNHLCYASGNSEPQNAAPTLSVAEQRVDNYGQGFFDAGAAAVIAEGHGSINGMIRDLFTTHQSIIDMWRNQSDYNGNEFSFRSFRSPSFTAYMDPNSTSGGYYRSIIGSPDVRTDDVTGNLSVDASILPTRLAGADRYATAVAISKAMYAPGVPVVYIATGATFPDALAGAAAAGLTGGPLLTVPATSIPAATAAELTRLKPAKIIVLGGTGTVSDGVKAKLAKYTAGSVTRLAGADRYATAVAISKAMYAPGVPVVYIATGATFPDALAGAAAAGLTGGPLLTVPATSIPAATAAELTRLKPAKIIVLGGTGTVSDGVKAKLAKYTAGSVTRLAGADRYATAVAISKAMYAPGVPVVYIATGATFPDALAGAAAAGLTGGPLLTVPATSIPAATAAELTRLKPAKIIVLGGTGTVSQATLLAMAHYVAS